MTRILSIFFFVVVAISCSQPKNNENIQNDTITVSIENPKQGSREDRTIRIFPLDSILEINYYTFKTTNGDFETSGVNIIDRQKNHWLFDSEGPQIESNSDIEKISDSLFFVSVYYDFLVSSFNDTLTKSIRIAKFDLRLNSDSKTYTFQKDTLFWPTPSPFNSRDIQRTILDYEKQLNSKFIGDSTNNDQPHIWRMFKAQKKLLSSFISGCDSCEIYSDRLFQKFDHALFASDSDYAGEIGSVFNILNTSQRKASISNSSKQKNKGN